MLWCQLFSNSFKLILLFLIVINSFDLIHQGYQKPSISSTGTHTFVVDE